MSILKKPALVFVCIVAVLAASLALVACDDENAGGSGRSGKAGGDSEVLAVADGQDVTRKQVDELCLFASTSFGMPMDNMTEDQKTIFFNQTLIYMAESILMKNSVDESDSAAAEGAKTTVDQQMEMFKGQDADAYQQILDSGVSEETIRTYIEAQYYQGLFYEKVTKEQPVTDDEAKAYYDANMSLFVTPEAIGLSHILISDENHSDESRTSMEAIRQRALDGEDFAELAKTYSADTSNAESGGDLGEVPRGRMVAPFDEAGFKLKKGEISDIVETEYGFHIIKANTDIIPEQQVPFESAREEIDNKLLEEKFYAELDKLKEEHPVKYNVDMNPDTGEPLTTDPAASGAGVVEDQGSGTESDTDSGAEGDGDDGGSGSDGSGAEGESSP
jgi:foldase protein PrsA